MKRDIALVLIGAWLLGTVAMAAVAMQNFYTVDDLLDGESNRTFDQGVALLDGRGDPVARDFLRYLSSELNRLYFMGWGIAETVIGVTAAVFLWRFPEPAVRWAALAMVVLTVILTFGVTGPIVEIGRQMDFVPRDPPPPEMAMFGLLHAAYSIADGVKLLLGGFLLVRIVRRGSV